MSESHPTGISYAINVDYKVRSKQSSLFTLHSLKDNQLDYRVDAWEAWQNTVVEYSKKKLTQTDDKLVAISAIMRQLQPFIGYRYLAGRWEDDLFTAA